MTSKRELIEKYKLHVQSLDSPNYKLKKSHIKIATYNVQCWNNIDGRKSYNDILQVINGINANVIGLTEALFLKRTARTLTEFKNDVKMLGYEYVCECNSTYGINVILSRHEIISHEVIQLEKDTINFQNRYALLCTVSIGNHNVKFCLTHLDVYDETEQTRLKQIGKIMKNIDVDTILMGDFNSLNSDDYDDNMWRTIVKNGKKRSVDIVTHVLDLIKQNDYNDMYNIVHGDKLNIVSVWSNVRVDYIFKHHDCKHKVKQCYFVKSLESDHLPLVAHIRLGK
jgi:endonuclease/exonuclease/phosphatase family metal-dependent hydrolase